MVFLSSLPIPLILVFLATVHVCRVISSALTSPLKHIPSPWFANFTRLVLKYHIVTGNRMYYIDSLHQKYGPVIRIAPDEVSIADPDGFIAIHRMGSGFNKPQFYQGLVFKGKPIIFTMTDPKMHAARRKLFARAFTVSSLRENCEAVVREKVELAVDRLRAEALNGSSDIHKWWTLMATDIVGQLCFGESFGMLESGKKNRYIQALDAVASASSLRVELPWLHSFLCCIPTKSVQLMANTRSEMIKYSRKAVDNLRRTRDNRFNLFATILAESDVDERADINDEVIRSEAGNMLIAGSDTVSTSLTYLVWAILKRPQLQLRLKKELSGLGGDFNDAALEELPLLNATMNESLRLYGAVPGSLPRVTPASGTTFCGHFIPGGTMVATQAYSTHRLPGVFPNPLQFDETRFLPGALTETQKLVFSPFGTGSRSCLGVSLARMEMRLAIALLFSKCDGLRLSDSMKDGMMDMKSFIVMKPAANRCDVTLSSK